MKSLTKFNKNLEIFITHLNINYFNKLANEFKISNDDERYILKFYNDLINVNTDISIKNNIFKNIDLIKNINLYEILNSEDIDINTKNNIWSNIHTLYILAIEYNYKCNIKDIIKYNKENLDDDLIKSLKIMIKNLANKEPESKSENIKDEFNMAGIFGNNITELANEIAEDIDIESIKNEDPNKLINDLLTGNMNNSSLGNLVNNITSKIHNKINNGDLNQEDLFKDATNIINNMNNNDNPLNSYFHNL
jgi:hypothetical protein